MDMQMVADAYKYFNGGRTQSKREYCRAYLPKVYEVLENMIAENKKELFIPHKILVDSCYSANEILYIITGDISSKNKEVQFEIGKKHWLKGWHITLKR